MKIEANHTIIFAGAALCMALTLGWVAIMMHAERVSARERLADRQLAATERSTRELERINHNLEVMTVTIEITGMRTQRAAELAAWRCRLMCEVFE